MNYKIFYPKNIYKSIINLTIIDILLLLAIIVLFYFIIYKNSNKYENFSNETNRNQYTHLLDNNIYDEFYCKYYDKIFLDKNKNQYEIDFITNITNDKNNNVLDIGCGTGHHVNYLTEYFKNTIGIDQSIEMVNTAKHKYPHCNYYHIDIFEHDTNQELDTTYNIITCLGKTIYCIQDKENLINIIHRFLEPNGFFFVHLIDKDTFLPQNNYINHNVVYNSNKYNRDSKINKYIIKFKDYEYVSEYNIIDNENNNENNNNINNINNINNEYNNKYSNDYTINNIPYSQYIEKFTNNSNSNNIRKYEYNLYLPDNIELINFIKNNGFKYYKKLDLANVGYKNQYIYAFIKS